MRRASNAIADVTFVTISYGGKAYRIDRDCMWLNRGKDRARKTYGRTRLNSRLRLRDAKQVKPHIRPCKSCAE